MKISFDADGYVCCYAGNYTLTYELNKIPPKTLNLLSKEFHSKKLRVTLEVIGEIE